MGGEAGFSKIVANGAIFHVNRCGGKKFNFLQRIGFHKEMGAKGLLLTGLPVQFSLNVNVVLWDSLSGISFPKK